METRFILQGFTAETHLKALRQLLNLPLVQRAIVSVAYSNRGGVDLVAEQLTALNGRVRVFTGIRNGVTSKQGLARLLQLGTEVLAVDTGARGIIFHPKLYFIRAQARVSLLIGSANLTVGGLNNNIEAGVQIDLDPALPADVAFGERVEARFDGLQAAYPNNVIAVVDEAQIDALYREGRLEDEQARPATARSTTTPPPPGTVPRIRLQVPVLHPAPPPATPASCTGGTSTAYRSGYVATRVDEQATVQT